MLANLFEVRKTKNKGLGLFATQFIPKGTIVCFECEKCKKIRIRDIEKLNQEKIEFLRDYGYTFGDSHIHIDCDEAKHMNHSCDSNVLLMDSNRYIDIVVKDIRKGQEATYDYRQFALNDFDFVYKGMKCECNNPNCCKLLYLDKSLIHLKEKWSQEIKSALSNIYKIEQPLLALASINI